MSFGYSNTVFTVFAILGLGFEVFSSIAKEEIIDEIPLKKTREPFEGWQSTPTNFTFKVYIFDVVNVDEIMQGATPLIREMGPYVYKQYRERHDIKYNEEDDTLEYMQNMQFEFDAEASFPRTEYDTVTVLNVPLQNILQQTEDYLSLTMNHIWQRVFQDSTTIFHKITVRNLLFDGYRFCDPASMQGVEYTIARQLCSMIRSDFSSDTITIDDDQTVVFSFFNHKITMDDGPYVVKAGNRDVSQFGDIQTWRGLNYLDIWEGGQSQCNRIRGRDFWTHPPLSSNASSFYIFNSDICRITTLRLYHQDVDGYTAILDSDTFSNINDGECYCTKATRNLQGENNCFPEGFADMYTCMHGPMIMSFPHFLWADEEYSSTVEGLCQNEKDHGSFVTVEPKTGILLEGARRMQFNMVIRPIQNIYVTGNLSSAILPILWTEEEGPLKEIIEPFEGWQSRPTNFTFKVYIFDMINVDEIMQGLHL